jgi:hypothetical protein
VRNDAIVASDEDGLVGACGRQPSAGDRGGSDQTVSGGRSVGRDRTDIEIEADGIRHPGPDPEIDVLAEPKLDPTDGRLIDAGDRRQFALRQVRVVASDADGPTEPDGKIVNFCHDGRMPSPSWRRLISGPLRRDAHGA